MHFLSPAGMLSHPQFPPAPTGFTSHALNRLILREREEGVLDRKRSPAAPTALDFMDNDDAQVGAEQPSKKRGTWSAASGM